jgi:hypothetical protein
MPPRLRQFDDVLFGSPAAVLVAMMVLMNHAQDAAEFIRDLGALAARLADKQIVVTSLEAHWHSFGSWSFRAQTEKATKELFSGRRYTKPYSEMGQEVLQVSWDGCESVLDIASSMTTTSGGGGQWKREHSERRDPNKESLFHLVEDYLTKRLSR